MNENHALCSSPEWAEYLQTTILPAVVDGVDLGDELLEVGPGPGAATAWLRSLVQRVMAVEYERPAADALARRFAGTNVEVLAGDATELPFPAGSFDSVASFTMLHHVPTAAGQQRLLSEACRVLRPGGVLVGSDSVASDELRHFHEGDTYNPVEPDALRAMLRDAGFCEIAVTLEESIRFVARKPPFREGARDAP